MFKKHLLKSKATYPNHLLWAVGAGGRMICAGICSIIHGLVPALFNGTAPKTIIDIYHSHLVNHPNEDYKNMIEKAQKDNA